MISDRLHKDNVKDLEVLKLILETRHRVYNFARDHGCKIRHYTLDGYKPWDYRQMMLSTLDMYRTFAAGKHSDRAELYGRLAWTNCTFTILPSLKMVMRNNEYFGRETDEIMYYCYHSSWSRKVKKRKSTLCINHDNLICPF